MSTRAVGQAPVQIQDSSHDGLFWQLVRLIQNICKCFFPKSPSFLNPEPLKAPSYSAVLSDDQKIFSAKTDFDKLQLLRDYVVDQKKKSDTTEVSRIMQRAGTPQRGTPKRKVQKEDLLQKVDLKGYQSIKLMLRDATVEEIEESLSDDKLRAMVKHLEELNGNLEALLTLLNADTHSFAFKAVVICSVFEKHTGICDLTSKENFFRQAWDVFAKDYSMKIRKYYLSHYPDQAYENDPLLKILKIQHITESDDVKKFICLLVDHLIEDAEKSIVDEQYDATPTRLRQK